MLPSLSLTSSPNSAWVMVDKATSELLIAPDWAMNMEICDSINSDHWNTKEVVKAVKKRLQHKNPRVQMLTLTLLETIVKNCGDRIHFHIAERKILDDMIKIVKKKADLQVRGKILMLLDSWQEAFGGPGGKHTQYYWAYDELRRSGVQFPQRSLATAPIITPPAIQLSTRNRQVRPGMSSTSSRRLDEVMASDVEALSASVVGTIRNAMELLADMLQAINPSDQMSVKDEVIVDLVDQCRSNQRALMQMLATTIDEELLGQGLGLNDALQVLLLKHDAIASGSPLPAHVTSTASSRPNAKPSIQSGDTIKGHAVEEEEEDDEFAQLAKRHSRSSSVPAGSKDAASSSSSNGPTFSASATPESTLSNALVPVDPFEPVKATKEQDMVDLLSIVLSTSFVSEAEPNPQTPKPAPEQNYSGAQPTSNSYVVPWAESQPQQQQLQMQAHFPPQYASANPRPPWVPTPGYATGRTMMTAQYTYSITQEAENVSKPAQGLQSDPYKNQQPVISKVLPLQYSTSFENSPSANQSQLSMNPSATAMGARGGSGGGGVEAVNTCSPMGQKPYIPSYRLFEDLNVFGKMEGKMRSAPYPSAFGSSGQSLVGGRR